MRIDLSDIFPNTAGDSATIRSMETAEQESIGAFAVQMDRARNSERDTGKDGSEKIQSTQTTESAKTDSKKASSNNVLPKTDSSVTETATKEGDASQVSITNQASDQPVKSQIIPKATEANPFERIAAPAKMFAVSTNAAAVTEAKPDSGTADQTTAEANLRMSRQADLNSGRDILENQPGRDGDSWNLRPAAIGTEPDASGGKATVAASKQENATALQEGERPWPVDKHSTEIPTVSRGHEKAVSDKPQATVFEKISGDNGNPHLQAKPNSQPKRSSSSEKHAPVDQNTQSTMEGIQRGTTVSRIPASHTSLPSQADVRSASLHNSIGVDLKLAGNFNSSTSDSGNPVSGKPEPGASTTFDPSNSDDNASGQESRQGNRNMTAFVQAEWNGSALHSGRSLNRASDTHQTTSPQLQTATTRLAGSSQATGDAQAPTAQPKEFVFQLAEQIHVQVRNGRGVIRIQLKPESLGRMEIRAETTNAGVTARITAESSNVKTYLENNLHLLQQMLQEQGLRADRVHIMIQSELEAQSSSGFNTQFGQARSGQNSGTARNAASQSKSAHLDPLEEIVMDPLTWIELNPNISFHTFA